MSSWLGDRGGVPRDGGLTLIELMVAAAVSMILIVSVYAIYSISTRGFKVQEQMTGAMQQARFGIGQLQRDLASAGFLGTPNSDVDPNVCPKPATRIPGIVFTTSELTGAVANSGKNVNIRPQEVAMFGAFWSPALYFTKKIDGNKVYLQDVAGAPLPQTLEEFRQVFRAKRLLRIVNADQFEMYLPIQDVDFGERAVVLSGNVPVATPPNYCGVQGFGVGLEANVVGVVRYRLQTDTSDPTNEPGKVDLVRQELDPSDDTWSTVITDPPSTVRIAEYVADLQFYDFTVDADLTRRQPVQQQYATLAAINGAAGHQVDLSVGARPQDLRFVTVKLTTRTREEDESVRFVPRAALDKPLDFYDVNETMQGSARTVTLAARVGLPSFHVRNVK